MASHAWVCLDCQRKDATCFCTCENRFTLLCDDCVTPHREKNLSTIHTNVPVAAYGHRIIPGYLDRLSARLSAKAAAQNKVEETVACIEVCEQRLQADTEALIATVSQFRESLLSHLRTWKEYLKRAVLEAEHTVYDESPNYLCDLTREMIDEWPMAGTEFQYLTVKVDLSPCYRALELAYSETVRRPAARNPPPVNICVVKAKEVTVFDLTARSKSKFRVVCNVTLGTVFSFVQNGVLMGVGGYPSTTDAFVIDTSLRELRAVSPMATPRNIAGVIGLDGALYVFGGYRGKEILTTSEKYSLSTDKWGQLPSMAIARAMFSPCEFQRQVFLIDASQVTRAIEVFSVSTETYSVFPVELPSGRYYSVAVVAAGELVVFGTGKKVCRLRLAGETSFRVGEFSNGVEQAGCSVHPVVLDRKVFFVNYECADLLEFDLDRNTLVISSLQQG